MTIDRGGTEGAEGQAKTYNLSRAGQRSDVDE